MKRLISPKNVWFWLSAAAILLGLLFQGYFWAQEFGSSFRRVYASLGQSAVWRSANFSQSQKFADYIIFLLRSVPQDMRVVLPPQDAGPKILGTTPMMQFFLFPRQVINCDSPGCVASLSLENSAVLLVGGFPGAAAESLPLKKLMFDDSWGVLLPAGKTGVEVGRPADLLNLGAQAVLPAVWLGLLALAGWLVIRRFLPDCGMALGISLGYGLGLGVQTLTLAFLSMLSVPLTSLLVGIVSAGLVLTGLIAAFAPRSVRGDPTPRAGSRPDPWLAGLLTLALAAAFLSVGLGYHASDELLIWGPKGYGIAQDQSIAGVMGWGTNTVHYPLHVPLLVAAFKLLFTETLPASKLAFAGYYAAVLVLVYKLLAENGLKRSYAACAAAFFGLAPLVFRHATLAYANLPLGYALLAALMLYFQERKAPTRFPAFTGLFLAIAAWTRPEGLVMAWSAFGMIFLVRLVSEGAAPARRTGVAVFAPLAIYTVLWQLLLGFAYPRPASQSALFGQAFSQFRTGALHLADLGYILRALLVGLLDASTWGLLGASFFIIFGLAIVLQIRRPGIRWATAPAEVTLLLASGLLFLGLITAIYYLASYDTNHDLAWWINTGLDRMLLPAILLLYSGGMAWVGKLLNHRENSPSPGNA